MRLTGSGLDTFFPGGPFICLLNKGFLWGPSLKVQSGGLGCYNENFGGRAEKGMGLWFNLGFMWVNLRGP